MLNERILSYDNSLKTIRELWFHIISMSIMKTNLLFDFEFGRLEFEAQKRNFDFRESIKSGEDDFNERTWFYLLRRLWTDIRWTSYIICYASLTISSFPHNSHESLASETRGLLLFLLLLVFYYINHEPQFNFLRKLNVLLFIFRSWC
jgi:hypothetical protein